MNPQPVAAADCRERAVLVAVIRDNQDPRQTEEFLDELEFLAETADICSVKRFTQRLPQPSSRIYVGPGKLEEIAAYCREHEIDVVIFDDELTPSQTRNIEKEMPCRLLDRTRLILDIFMSRARTAYAKTQVQLANYEYMLPRLSGLWTHLERQRGGTGTRGGAGEREIETDRRIIRNRIAKLKEDLKKIDRQMAVQRSNRGAMVRVALVGYTNVGKSTLMNLISKSEVFAENKLFATLDTTVRKVVLENLPFLLSDTVGFIRKLPTHLVEAFKATLEELTYADLLLHVIDLSNPEWEAQADVVDRLIDQPGAAQTPCIRVFNKCDAYLGILPHGENIVCISARSGEGANELTERVRAILGRADHHVTLLLPYAQGALLETLHRDCAVLRTDYRDDGIALEVIIHPEQWPRLEPFVIPDEEV